MHDLEDEIHGLEDKIAILENDAKLSKTEITDLNSRLIALSPRPTTTRTK